MPKTDHRKNLTPTLISGLKPAALGQRYQVMDAQVPGFGVRVTDKGHKAFILRTRYPGSSAPARREIGNCADLALAGAREKARKCRSLVAQGIDPVVEEERLRQETLRNRAMTFAMMADDFIRQKLSTERRGDAVEREIRRDLSAGVEQEANWINRRYGRAHPDQTEGAERQVRGAQSVRSTQEVFPVGLAQRTYGLISSPCEGLQFSAIAGEMKRARDRILSDDEIFAYWRAATRLPYPHGPTYRGLMLTALRVNELADASQPEFDYRDRLWVIPANRMKGKNAGKKQARAHAVPLTDDLICSRYAAIARVRRQDARAVELRQFVVHDVRRTVRSQLSRLKVAEEVREAVLAHVRPGVKGTYDHYNYAGEKREALQLWAARLREIVNRPIRPQNNLVALKAVA